MSRTYDVTVFGATGFTGRQAAESLCRLAPPSARIAIAGRNRAKLDALAKTLPRLPAVVVADTRDAASIAQLCRDIRRS